jgi:cytoskeletal protein CcmA (bactofilin family)
MARLYDGELSTHVVAELTVRTGFKISLRRLGMLLTLLLVPAMAGAATSRFGETVTVTAPVSDDAYLVGGRVTVEQPLASDAVAAGGTVLFNAPVGLDLLAAGGDLLLNGSVGDDARVAGGNVLVNGDVNGDLVVAAGRVLVSRRVVVGGDLWAAAGKLELDGSVQGNVRAAAGEMTVAGEIGGGADLHARRLVLDGRVGGDAVVAARELTFGPQARFGGNLRYWRPEGPMEPGAVPVKGTASFDSTLRLPEVHGLARAAAAAAFAWWAATIFSGAVVLLALLLLYRSLLHRAGEEMQHNFWGSGGKGFLFFVLTPVSAIVLAVTVIGLPLGLFLILLFLFTVWLSPAFSAPVLAEWLQRRRNTEWGTAMVCFSSLGLFVALELLLLVPVLGWLAVAVLVCVASGAVMTTEWRLLRG